MSQDEKNNENNEEIVEETEIESEEDTSKKIDSEEEGEDSSEEEDDGLDYKSEYERLQGELAQKNERIAKQDKKIIKLKRNEFDDEEDNSEDKADNADLNELVSKKVQEQMTSFVEDTIDEELDKLSSNEDEKKLIKWYFDNRIVKSGWAKKDVIQYLGEAKALANAKKFLATSKMLAKKVKSDETKGSPNFSGTPAKQSPKATEHDKKMADKFFKGDIKKWLKYKS